MNDFTQHNSNTKELWDLFNKGNARRVPVIAGISSRYVILDEKCNPKKHTFEEYHNNPAVMFEMQLELERFRRFDFMDDSYKGLPEDGWGMCVDFQNVYEAAWFGCEVIFHDKNVPDTLPLYNEKTKYEFIKKPFPNAFGGIMNQAKNTIEYYKERAEKETFMGLPINKFESCASWTDGPFTTACKIMGTDNFCLDMLIDPEFAEQVLDYITDATIYRISEWRKYQGVPAKIDGWGLADDMIQLLSVEMVQGMLLPRYKRMLAALKSEGTQSGIHLCGDSTRHMPLLRDELNLASIDTGFPMNFSKFSKDIGPDVAWQGGPHISLLLNGTPSEIDAECKRILAEVMPNTRKFILRDANDIAPFTSLKNINAMIEAGKKYGVFNS